MTNGTLKSTRNQTVIVKTLSTFKNANVALNNIEANQNDSSINELINYNQSINISAHPFRKQIIFI